MGPVQLRGQTPSLERLGLSVELPDGRLVEHPEPQVFVFVKAQPKCPGWRSRLHDGHLVFSGLTGSVGRACPESVLRNWRTRPFPGNRQSHRAAASCVRGVVLGVDDLRGSALRTRQCFELVLPLWRCAQIDARQVVSLSTPCLPLLFGIRRTTANPRRGSPVWVSWKRERRIRPHPCYDLDPCVRIVA